MPNSVDMTFVASDVDYGTWLEWGSSFKDTTDMVDQVAAKLGPGECIGRLIICTHGSPGGGLTTLDGATGGVETISGSQIDPTVKAQLQRLRMYFCPDGVIEFRCCEFGMGSRGTQALQAIADLTGVAVTAPEDSIQEVMFFGGLSVTWRTAYPSTFGVAPTSSWWRGEGIQPAPAGTAGQAGAAAAAATPRFVPVPGINPAPPGPAVVSPEMIKGLPAVSSSPTPVSAGYSELDRFGGWLARFDDPDTPPPTDYGFGHLQTGVAPQAQPYMPAVPAVPPEPPSQGPVDWLQFRPSFTTGRTGCVALVGVAAVAALAMALTLPGMFGFGHSSSSSSALSGPGATASAPGASSRPNAASCSGAATLIVDQFYPDLVQGGNGTPPSFSTGGKKYCLTHLATYHWNGGQGVPPLTQPNPSPTASGGSLSIRDASGKVIGSWPATATPGTGGALVNWEADVPLTPQPVILDGTYTVGDTSPATWSWSNASGHKGFIRIWAIAYTGP